MMKRLLDFILVFSLFSLCAYAQDDYTEKMKEVNKIKGNTNYLSAMGTSTKGYDDAFENAKSLLGLEVETWLAENKESDVAGYVAKSKEYFMKLDMKRGSLFRVFVYVRKKNVLPVYKEDDVLVRGIGEEAGSAAGGSVTTVDASADGKVVLEAQADSSQDLVQATVETVGEQKLDKVQNSEEVASEADKPVFELTSDEKEMLMVKKFDEITYYIKNNGITSYGKYATMPKDGTFHIFIYNRDGQVPACLRFEDGRQTNIATGQDDNVANYKGCGAFWFEKK